MILTRSTDTTDGRYYAEKSRQQQQEQPAADSTSAVAAEDGSSRSGGMSSSGGSDAVVTSSGEKDSRPPARQGGVYNHGLDDENFDYIVHEGEVFHGRYAVKETIGKGKHRLISCVLLAIGGCIT